MKEIISEHSTLYNWFGGAHHAPHSMLVKQSAVFNKGVTINLFNPAGTRMAGNLIAWHKDLRLKAALQATVKSAAYLAKSYGAEDKASEIVMDEFKWKRKFVSLRVMWPLVQILRTVDSNAPAMGVLFYACVVFEQHLIASEEALDDVFDPAKEDYDDENEFVTVFGQIGAAYDEHKRSSRRPGQKLGF